MEPASRMLNNWKLALLPRPVQRLHEFLNHCLPVCTLCSQPIFSLCLQECCTDAIFYCSACDTGIDHYLHRTNDIRVLFVQGQEVISREVVLESLEKIKLSISQLCNSPNSPVSQEAKLHIRDYLGCLTAETARYSTKYLGISQLRKTVSNYLSGSLSQSYAKLQFQYRLIGLNVSHQQEHRLVRILDESLLSKYELSKHYDYRVQSATVLHLLKDAKYDSTVPGLLIKSYFGGYRTNDTNLLLGDLGLLNNASDKEINYWELDNSAWRFFRGRRAKIVFTNMAVKSIQSQTLLKESLIELRIDQILFDMPTRFPPALRLLSIRLDRLPRPSKQLLALPTCLVYLKISVQGFTPVEDSFQVLYNLPELKQMTWFWRSGSNSTLRNLIRVALQKALRFSCSFQVYSGKIYKINSGIVNDWLKAIKKSILIERTAHLRRMCSVFKESLLQMEPRQESQS